MKKVIALMMVVLMVCALTGCSMDEDTKEHFLSLDTKPNDTGNESSETTQNQLPTELKFEYSSETASDEILSGKMNFTISNPRIINHSSDMPGGDFSSAVASIWTNGEVKEYVCYSKRFPSFIQEDGSFVEGVQLIAVDITVTNIDAVALTQKDADSEGKGGGNYTDPYVFRVDGLLGFTDTGASTGAMSVVGGDYSSGNLPLWSPCYFSALNNCTEHPFAFRLEHGETVTYTVGIVIGNNKDGSARDLSTIAVRIAAAKYVSGEESDIYYVTLGLGG